MGAPKALLQLAGASFLERLVVAMLEGGCGNVLVVVGAGDEHEEAARAARALGAAVAVNPDPASEQIHSLRVALRVLSSTVEGAMVSPVDVPLVSASLVDALITGFRGSGGVLALPFSGDRHGHPVLFGRALFRDLLEHDLPDGARSVVHQNLARAARVEVEPRVLNDVDTPEALRRMREGS